MAGKPAPRYASGTSVPIGKSQEQIKTELQRLGVQQRAFYDDDERGLAVIAFEREGIRYRISLPLANPRDDRFHWVRSNQYDAYGRQRTAAQARAAWEQDCAERWRALTEYIKSLRVAAEAGILHVAEALLPYVTLPSGETVGEWLGPQVPEVYARGEMPPFLPGAAPRGGAPRLLRAPGEGEEE